MWFYLALSVGNHYLSFGWMIYCADCIFISTPLKNTKACFQLWPITSWATCAKRREVTLCEFTTQTTRAVMVNEVVTAAVKTIFALTLQPWCQAGDTGGTNWVWTEAWWQLFYLYSKIVSKPLLTSNTNHHTNMHIFYISAPVFTNKIYFKSGYSLSKSLNWTYVDTKTDK